MYPHSDVHKDSFGSFGTLYLFPGPGGVHEIYPEKACINETAEMCRFCLLGRIESIGRSVGMGPGGRCREQRLL